MKFLRWVSLLILLLQIIWSHPVSATAQLSELEITKKAGQNLPDQYAPKGGTIVVDVTTGKVLYEQNASKQWPSASLAKMMTLYLAYEALADGRITSNQTFEVTQKYVDISQNLALSNNKMVLGTKYTFDEVAQLMMGPSSNAAAMLMADTVAGDEANFVKLMNEKAQALGMTQTKFYNSAGPQNELLQPHAPKGLPLDGDSMISARDAAILGYHLLVDYPQFLKNTSQYKVTVKTGTPYEETLTGHHYSLPGGPTAYSGTDGIKTGSSDSAGYNLVSTVKRGETRLIIVLLGVGTWPDEQAELGRNQMANAILDHVFATYSYRPVLAQGEQTVNGQEVIVDSPLYDMLAKDIKPEVELVAGKISVVSKASYLLPDQEAPQVTYHEVLKPEPTNQKSKLPFNLNLPQLKLEEIPWEHVTVGLIIVFSLLYQRLSYRRRRRKKRLAKRKRGKRKSK